MVFIKVMSGSEKNNDELFERGGEKEPEEILVRVSDKINHLLDSHDFNERERVGILSEIWIRQETAVKVIEKITALLESSDFNEAERLEILSVIRIK